MSALTAGGFRLYLRNNRMCINHMALWFCFRASPAVVNFGIVANAAATLTTHETFIIILSTK